MRLKKAKTEITNKTKTVDKEMRELKVIYGQEQLN